VWENTAFAKTVLFTQNVLKNRWRSQSRKLLQIYGRTYCCKKCGTKLLKITGSRKTARLRNPNYCRLVKPRISNLGFAEALLSLLSVSSFPHSLMCSSFVSHGVKNTDRDFWLVVWGYKLINFIQTLQKTANLGSGIIIVHFGVCT